MSSVYLFKFKLKSDIKIYPLKKVRIMLIKKIIILLSLLFYSCIGLAQENSRDTITKKETRGKKKAENELNLQKQFERNYQNLLDSSFVLEANFITFKSDRRFVNSTLNFLLVDSSSSILQIGTGYGIGFNGVGGSTAKGTITSYKLSKNDKRKSCTLIMSVSTMAGPFTIIFDVSADGSASATVSLKSGQLIYDGTIVPLKDSDVYKGNTWY